MKYLHIDIDTLSIAVLPELDTGWYGWAYEVPDDFVLTLNLDQLQNLSRIHEALDTLTVRGIIRMIPLR